MLQQNSTSLQQPTHIEQVPELNHQTSISAIHCDSRPKFSSQLHHGDTGGVSSKYCKVAVSLTIVT